jgi:hypothetical protein
MTGEERGEAGRILLLLTALPAMAVNRQFRESGERSVEMTFTGRVAGAVVSLLLTAGPAFAHHSFAAEFDVNKPVKLRGTLTKMEWINPHGWIYVDVKSPEGKVENWAVEAGSANALIRRGLRATDFPAGVQVVVEGYQAKNGSLKANGSTVTFADGRNFFLGASDTGAPPTK